GKKREEMSTRTGNDEQMPNEMAIAHTLVHEKEYACGVSDATGYQPEKRSRWNRQRDRPNRDKRQPPRAKIKSHPEFRMTRRSARRLQRHAENRERPNNYEYGCAPKATKWAYHERCVCSSNQQKDRRVVQHLQKLFPTRLRPR